MRPFPPLPALALVALAPAALIGLRASLHDAPAPSPPPGAAVSRKA